MKKYFIHNGTEQQGPFDISELRAQNIKRETMLWFEGIDSWTKAGDVSELKEIFGTIPPPFTKQKMPPPIIKTPQKEESKKNVASTEKIKQKNNIWKWIIGIIVIVIILLGGAVILNNPNSIPVIKLEINTPNPIIVTSSADGKKSGIFNAITSVHATIQNQGGAGNVLITFNVYQGGNTYDKSKSIYMSNGQSEDLEMIFEEVNYIDGEITYHVEARAK